ncbi:TlpA family protein disulfide reductase [Patescibacteria group bacterium AH-259-L07]|nr:TlpA family protein disulfide reductase [Patescibacteria group bacterium AH-259-L07]
MKYIIFIVIGTAIIIGAIVGFAGKEGTTDQLPSPKAPDFSLEDYNGNIVTLADFSGKLLVINSWAVWCPFCVKELQDFAKLQQEFGNTITIIAIDRAEPLNLQKQYTDDLGVTNILVFLLDPQDSFYRSIGGFSMPETIFVDSDSTIVFHKRGPMSLEEMRQKVKDVFAL